MSKIKLYVQNANNINLLSKYFDIENFSMYTYDNNKVYTDFDYIYIEDQKREDLEVFKAVTFGFPRLPKNQQMIVLSKLGIKHPPSFMSYSIYSLISYLDEYNDDDTFIVKDFFGARGLNQLKIKKEDLYNFNQRLEKKINIDDDFYNNLRENLGGSKKDPVTEELYSNEAIDDFIKNIPSKLVTKKIEIKKEYRVVYFYNQSPIIYERFIDGINWQSNLSTTNIEGRELDSREVSQEIINLAKKLGQHLDVPVLSIDIYIDDKDSIGCFEFQPSFAFLGLDKTNYIKKYKTAMFDFMNKKFNLKLK